MKRGAIDKLMKYYRGRRSKLLAELSHLKATEDKATKRLEKRCLKEHGAHEDNGGWMYGFCTRCGACLG